ncbi:lysostaphin resistance A-like protein [Geodermatophilus sp. SYSU D00814]
MSALDDTRTGRRQAAPPGTPARGFRSWAARHPIGAFLAIALPLGWVVLGIPALAEHGVIPGGALPGELFALAATVLVLLPTAVWVVSVTEGRAGVRALFARTFRWRFGGGWWLAALAALPVATVAVGLLLGRSLTADPVSVLVEAVPLMLLPVVLVNLWEETVWAGFVQTRLERRHGLLAGSALTAVAFAAIHLPLLLWGEITVESVATGLGIVFGAALVFRLLVGVFLRGAAGSVLAVAVLHGSWNGSSGEDGLVDDLLSGGQPVLAAAVALVVVTAVAVAVVRPDLTRRSRS